MQISEEDAQLIVDWLGKRCKLPMSCCLCNLEAGSFHFTSRVFSLPVFTKPGEPLEKAFTPVILLSCNNCGNINLLDATLLENSGCQGINILPEKPKKNILSFLDYFKKK